MKLRTLLELARISNLPTVWSNVVAGAVLGGVPPGVLPVVVVGASGSLLYSGGMFLNDAFDSEIDARERPERPIPSGRIARSTVLALGYGMLALALAILVTAGIDLAVAGAAVALGVVVYDRWHKGVVWSPVVMGFCRAGLYVMGALAVGTRLDGAVLLPAASLLFYVVGLTYVARFENASAVGRVWPTAFLLAPVTVVVLSLDLAGEPTEHFSALAVVLLAHVAWTLRALVIALRGGRGRVPRAVVGLIAGISLVDAAFIALRHEQEYEVILLPLAAFGLTLLFQRWVRGT